jgi:hypothetical protein
MRLVKKRICGWTWDTRLILVIVHHVIVDNTYFDTYTFRILFVQRRAIQFGSEKYPSDYVLFSNLTK